MDNSTKYILNFCMISLTVYYLFTPKQEAAGSDFAAEVDQLGVEVRQLGVLLKCSKLLEEKRSKR